MSSPRPHWAHGKYRNRYANEAHGPSWDLLKFLWRMRTEMARKPDLPQATPEIEWMRGNRTQSSLTWVGHSTFVVQWNGLNVITDPHLSARASPLKFAGPKRFLPPALDYADLPPLDIALISHNHYDHLDEPTVRRLAQEHPQLVFVVPMGLKRWLLRRNIRNVIELDWWQSAEVLGGQVHAVPVQHFSGRTATDRNATLWCGLVLAHKGRKLFFAGDTGYSRDFADIAERLGAMDLSLIPIGAYEPRSFMRPVHVNPEEAVRIHQDVQSRLSVAMHWGSFRLTLEAMDQPPKDLAQALAAAGIPPEKFLVMRHGETRRL